MKKLMLNTLFVLIRSLARCHSSLAAFKYCLATALIAFASSVNAIDIVTISKQQTITQANNLYYLELIQLALEKSSDKFGSYQLKETSLPIPQKRTVQMLAENKQINLIWTMTSIQRETELNAIYIPLLKGLLGYRVFIINKDDLHKFDTINALDQLSLLKAGQGAGWPDTDILKHNGLPVIESRDYQHLFSMLKAKRYDYFPRGITEAWDELNTLNDPTLIVEPNLLLRYKAPIYFFVNKDNQRLHQRFSYGLTQAINDGSFDELFLKQSVLQESINRANISKRTVIELNNPNALKRDIFSHSKFWMTQHIESEESRPMENASSHH